MAIERYFGQIDLHFRNCFEIGRIQITGKLEVQQFFGYLRSHWNWTALHLIKDVLDNQSFQLIETDFKNTNH